ncbi:MAG: hypothetical protein O3C09_00850 [Proteobacteria bacterium]|nr:hypothetical protein [Pseudomonadota bacterium]MDA1060118.1 hypothetical protein [Pseudomonadota bacterium]
MNVTSSEPAAGALTTARTAALADPDSLEQAGDDAIEQGNLALAEMAFLKLCAAQPSAATHARVYEVAAARTHYALAQRALEALIDFEPNNVRALEHLAHMRGLTGDAPGATDALRRALMIEPKNPTLATAYAIWAQECLDHFHEVPALLTKAAELDEDGAHLEQIVDALLYQQRFKDAEHYAGVFQARTGSLNPRMLRYLGVALAGQGRQDEAREVFSAAIAACNELLPEKPASATQWRAMDTAEAQRQCELYAFRARLEHQAGQSSSAMGTYGILRDAAEARGLSYPDGPQASTSARLGDLRRLIAGRDLAILCQGHSLADFAARIGELGTRNPAFASFGRFGVVEHDVLKPAHRALDIAVALGAGSVAGNLKHMKTFLQQSRRTMAIVSPDALDAAFDPESRAAFLSVNGNRLLAAAGNPLRSVTPDDPLGMIQENSLLAALPLLVAARPKRVFLIGADYAIPTSKTTSHFGIASKHFAARTSAEFAVLGNDTQQRDNFDTTMRFDAATCDRDLGFQIAAVAALHGFAAPPVFNVSCESRLQSLPKISLDAFFEMVG